jgi:peptidoglycan hydrolase CwlO-like protein
VANRADIDEHIKNAENTLESIKEQLDKARQQQGADMDEFTQAQQQLEQTYGELDAMMRSANSQQRYQLQLMQRQVRTAQHEMILAEQTNEHYEG